jgi:hypothetical protein
LRSTTTANLSRVRAESVTSFENRSYFGYTGQDKHTEIYVDRTKLNAALCMLAPLDDELAWIAAESSGSNLDNRRSKGLPINHKHWALSFCPQVAQAVGERLKSENRLTRPEACLIGLNAINRLDPNREMENLERVQIAARFVASAAVLRAHCPVSYGALDPYQWPFGLEGGHFNPEALEADETIKEPVVV